MYKFEFLKFTDKWISGDEMLAKAKELKATAGKEECDWLLAHQDQIPKEYQGNNYLIFPEYTKLNSDDDRDVAYLYWDGDAWILNWHWLDDDFSSDGLVVRARKSLETGKLGSSGPLDALSLVDEIQERLNKLKKIL